MVRDEARGGLWQMSCGQDEMMTKYVTYPCFWGFVGYVILGGISWWFLQVMKWGYLFGFVRNEVYPAPSGVIINECPPRRVFLWSKFGLHHDPG